MKIFICVDFEGMPSVNDWSDVTAGNPEYERVRVIATDIVATACKSAIDAGATEIWVKDAHDTARNILPEMLPNKTKLVRGWTECPNGMIAAIDNKFDGIVFLGMHSENGNGANPLSHTIMPNVIDEIKIDGVCVGEFEIYSRLAKCYGVPTILLVGDEGLTSRYSDKLPTVSTFKGIGGATVMIKTIAECKAEIVAAMKVAIGGLKRSKARKTDFGKDVELLIKYVNHKDCYKASFYPNSMKLDDRTVKINCPNYFEIMRTLLFLKKI
ncbi:MAG: M55 family metallopeptidase [Firmicutes bacterium]|nr:M55 family metallopeptidase [Bacillota bacterium]